MHSFLFIKVHTYVCERHISSKQKFAKAFIDVHDHLRCDGSAYISGFTHIFNLDL